jgi:lipopolysaccharide transport system ATP-binding protein
MTNKIIKVENLSKRYRIGTRENGYKTFREAIIDNFTAPIRNFKRLRKLSHFDDTPLSDNKKLLTNNQKSIPNNRQQITDNSSQSDVIWALKDVSFEVKQGDVVGIIGRNGSGKSTLLKILSRITEPTSGEVKLHGRVSSLLEVGTGFHPELTGRENIYLNGAILGMRKKEIENKFDEIVDFAEIEKFIDTPVKRYSSGMYVRLAFAVAAHLEPEILIVDEVLSVGDIQFQKKCLSKMENVANDGKTLLLVSHNLPTILSMSNEVLLLDAGRVIEYGSPYQVARIYQDSFKEGSLGQTDLSSVEHYGNGLAKFRSIKISQFNELGSNIPVAETGCKLVFTIEIEAFQDFRDGTVALIIYDALGNRLIDANTLIKGDAVRLTVGKIVEVKFTLKNVRLKPDVYTAGLWMGVINQADIDGVHHATSFRVEAKRKDILYTHPFPGAYACEFEHEVVQRKELKQ